MTGQPWVRSVATGVALAPLATGTGPASAQRDVAPLAAPGVMTGVKQGGSPNVHVLCHLPLGGFFRVMDNEIEQDQPYAYVSQARDPPAFTILELLDTEHCKVVYHWRI